MPARIEYRGFIFLAAMSFAIPAVCEDWSQYRGPDGDGKSSEVLREKPWDSDSLSAVVWKTKTPLGFSSFVASDGRLFTIIAEDEQEITVAIDAGNGEELWRVVMGSSDYPQGGGGAGARDNKGGDGPRSTPAVADGKVYVYDSYMMLRCLNAKTGDLIWKRDVASEFSGKNIKWLNATSPLIEGDRVYVSGGGAGQSFLAFDRNDGKLIWSSGDETITHATPTLASINDVKQIVFFVQSGLVGIEADTGKELWRTKFPFSVSTAASPVVDGNLVYCSAGYGVGAGLFRVKPNWQVEEVWFKANELMNHWSTPVVYKGHLYGLYEFKKYGRAPLQCVDLMTGEIKWSERGFGPGNCILVGDQLIVLSDAGEVAIAAATPDQYIQLSRAEVLDGKCWSTPAFDDGTIYVRSTVEAAAIKVAP